MPRSLVWRLLLKYQQQYTNLEKKPLELDSKKNQLLSHLSDPPTHLYCMGGNSITIFLGIFNLF